MAGGGRERASVAARAAWPLLFLTAVLHAYLGLSAVAYVFMGVSDPSSGPGGWTVAGAGALQAVAAVAAFALALRGDLRGATLAVAGCILLGWLSTLPSVAAEGLDFRGEDRFASVYFVLAPLIAVAGATLAWRNPYPVAAALVVTATTAVGIVATLVLAVAIAIGGF